MKDKNLAVPLIVSLGLVLLWLNGCGGVSKSSNFYVLTPVAAAATPGNKVAGLQEDIAVGISHVSLPKYLKRPQIVTRKGDNELHLAEFERWAGKIEEDTGNVIAENLAYLLATDKVFTQPAMQVIEPDYYVTMEISRFDGSLAGNIELVGRWALLDGHGNILFGVKATQIVEPVNGSAYADLVAAQSRALYIFSREIAAAIKQQGKR